MLANTRLEFVSSSARLDLFVNMFDLFIIEPSFIFYLIWMLNGLVRLKKSSSSAQTQDSARLYSFTVLLIWFCWNLESKDTHGVHHKLYVCPIQMKFMWIYNTLRTSALWFPKASKIEGRNDGSCVINSSCESLPTSWKRQWRRLGQCHQQFILTSTNQPTN